MDIEHELKSFFKGEIDSSPDTLEKYSRDASLFYIKPSLVVSPRDVDDIKRLVCFVSEQKAAGNAISLTPRLAGTDMSGGPLTDSIVVDMKPYFNRLKEIGADFAIVEPGMYYRDFEKETLARGLLMPSYPASRDLCTIGGMVANNSGGEKTLAFGKTERYVQYVKAVLADGNEYTFSRITRQEFHKKAAEHSFEGALYKNIATLIDTHQKEIQNAKPQVSKNSSGYALWNVYDAKTDSFDLAQFLVGSQGTLGIITEIKLKLISPKPASRLLVIFLKDLKHLGEISDSVLALNPESFESYDDNTFRLAFKFFPEILGRIKGNMFRLALSFIPEAWMILSGGVPKLVLLAEFTADTETEAETKAMEARNALSHLALQMRVTRSKEETEEFWVIRRESFSLLRKHVRGLRTAPFIDDFSVPPHSLTEFLPKLYEILGKYKFLYTIAGHIGDGNFHIIPLMDLSKPESKKAIQTLSEEVYNLIIQYKGSITGEHNDGLIRGPFLEKAFGKNIYELFEQVKHAFDPAEIFNPHKKVGVSLDYAFSRIDTKM